MKVFAVELYIRETTTKTNTICVCAPDGEMALAWVNENYYQENFAESADPLDVEDSLVDCNIDHELTEEEIAALDEIWNAGPGELNTKEDVLALARTLSENDLKALLEERQAK